MLKAKSIVSEFSQVIAENLFIQIPEEMELFDADICAFQLPLEQAPEVFESVGVNLSINVAFRMVHDLMLEVLVLEHIVGVESVSVDRAVRFDVTANLSSKNWLSAIGNDGCADLATALKHSMMGLLSLVPVSVIRRRRLSPCMNRAAPPMKAWSTSTSLPRPPICPRFSLCIASRILWSMNQADF